MADDEALRQIARYFADTDKRERAAEQRQRALVDAITRGFEGIAKEIHEGFTRLEHLWLDSRR